MTSEPVAKHEPMNVPAICSEEPEDLKEPPKVSTETRHSIGSYVTTGRGVASLGVHRENAPLSKSRSEIQVCATNSLSVSQTSRNSLITYSSSGTFYDHSKRKINVRALPKPLRPNGPKDTTDFRQMEQGLLQLLEDFHCGKLEGFGSNCTFQKMENVREQQEKLARLHFDLNAQQELCGQHTSEGITMAKGNLSKLMENYPIMYSDTNEKFNCMQRVHANYLEMFPTFLGLLFFGGLAHPLYSAIAGLVYLAGRLVYSIGYSMGDPRKRLFGLFMYFGLLFLLYSTCELAVRILRWI